MLVSATFVALVLLISSCCLAGDSTQLPDALSVAHTPTKFDNNDPVLRSHQQALLDMCDKIRNGGSTAARCDFMDTESFAYFVDYVSEHAPRGKSMSTVAEWKIRCMSGVLVRDPPVCWAAAYLMLPFPLVTEEGETVVDCNPKSEQEKDIREEPHPSPFSHSSVNDPVTYYNFKALTVETRNVREQSCALLRTACALGIQFQVLGQNFKGKMTRATKIQLVSEAIRKIPPNERNRTIIFNVDSSDVFLQLDKSTIIRRFLRQKTKLLFSAEADCFPFRYFPMSMSLGNNTLDMQGHADIRYKDFSICGKLFPRTAPLTQFSSSFSSSSSSSSSSSPSSPSSSSSSSSDMRWLNSGGWIGFADSILAAYDAASLFPKWFVNRWPGSDQGFFSTLYLTRRYGIKLDTCGEIFTTFKTLELFKEEDRSVSYWRLYALGPRMNKYNMVYLKEAPPHSPFNYVWVNKKTERVSAALHFNGGSIIKLDNDAIERGDVGKERGAFLRYCTPNRRMEVLMMEMGTNKKFNLLRAMGSSCQKIRKMGCFQDLHKLKKDGCSFDASIVEFLLDKKRSSLGLFMQLSPSRLFTFLSQEEHRAFLSASYAAVEAIGAEAWLKLVDGLHYIPGRHSSPFATLYLKARKTFTNIDGLVEGAKNIVLSVVAVVLLRWAWRRRKYIKSISVSMLLYLNSLFRSQLLRNPTIKSLLESVSTGESLTIKNRSV